jgi:hypothetical protein
MDLNTVDWSRVCGHVQYSGGMQVCVLAPHPVTEEHYHLAVERLPAQLEPCQATTFRDGVLYLCALFGQHMNRDHEWVRPSELRPGQIKRARPNTPGPGPAPVRHPTAANPLCLHPNPTGDGTVCALPPDHGLTGHGHHYVRLGGPGPGAGHVEPANPPGGEPPTSQPVGRPAGRPDEEYTPRREPDPQPGPGPRPAPTTGGTEVATVAEMRAAAAGINARLEEAQGSLRAAKDEISLGQQMAAATFDGSAHEQAIAGQAAMTEADDECNEAMRLLSAAIEAFNAYVAAL